MKSLRRWFNRYPPFTVGHGHYVDADFARADVLIQAELASPPRAPWTTQSNRTEKGR